MTWDTDERKSREEDLRCDSNHRGSSSVGSHKKRHNEGKLQFTLSPASLVFVLLHKDIHGKEHHEDQHAGHGGAPCDRGRLQQHLLPRVQQVRAIQVLKLAPLAHETVSTPVEEGKTCVGVLLWGVEERGRWRGRSKRFSYTSISYHS